MVLSGTGAWEEERADLLDKSDLRQVAEEVERSAVDNFYFRRKTVRSPGSGDRALQTGRNEESQGLPEVPKAPCVLHKCRHLMEQRIMTQVPVKGVKT